MAITDGKKNISGTKKSGAEKKGGGEAKKKTSSSSSKVRSLAVSPKKPTANVRHTSFFKTLVKPAVKAVKKAVLAAKPHH